MSDLYRTTYHRDGTCTVWDVYYQSWRRIAATRLMGGTCDALLATLGEAERTRIERHARRTGGAR